MKMMFTPYHSRYAYGWYVRKMVLSESNDSLNVVSHSGGINGKDFPNDVCDCREMDRQDDTDCRVLAMM